MLPATALEHAGTWVCEPLAELALEVPSSTAPGVHAALGRLGGRVTGQFSANGCQWWPRCCRSLASGRCRPGYRACRWGEGILETRFGGYQPIGENRPTRPRSTPSPLDRDAWLASLAMRG